MRKILFAMLAVFAVGCGSDEIVYRPHFDPDEVQQQKTAPTNQPPPKKSSRPKPAIVEKIGDVDVTQYGIPIYPGALMKPDQIFQFKDEVGTGRRIDVILESTDFIAPIADWYKNEIEATDAVADDQFASLKGQTSTGHPISVTVINEGGKSTISLTVTVASKR